MHKGPAFDCTYGRHFPDFLGFFPGCLLLGALLPGRDSFRSPDWTPSGGVLGRARFVSWGRVQCSKSTSYPLNDTALTPLNYPCRKYLGKPRERFLMLGTFPAGISHHTW